MDRWLINYGSWILAHPEWYPSLFIDFVRFTRLSSNICRDTHILYTLKSGPDHQSVGSGTQINFFSHWYATCATVLSSSKLQPAVWFFSRIGNFDLYNWSIIAVIGRSTSLSVITHWQRIRKDESKVKLRMLNYGKLEVKLKAIA